jgi:hypothetical protein
MRVFVPLDLVVMVFRSLMFGLVPDSPYVSYLLKVPFSQNLMGQIGSYVTEITNSSNVRDEVTLTTIQPKSKGFA